MSETESCSPCGNEESESLEKRLGIVNHDEVVAMIESSEEYPELVAFLGRLNEGVVPVMDTFVLTAYDGSTTSLKHADIEWGETGPYREDIDEMLPDFDEMVDELNAGHNLSQKQEEMLAKIRMIVFGGEE